MDEFDRIRRWQGQGPEGIEERRRILRSLGAGGAALGAPGLALAGTRPYCKKNYKNYNPTASAVGSLVGSVTGSEPPKYGYACSHYCSSGNWSPGWSNGKNRNLTWDLCGNPSSTSKMRFYVAFELSNPGSSSPKFRTCSNILNNYSGSDEAVWLTALLNANKCATRFPYLPGHVIDLYNNKNPLMGGYAVTGLSDKAKMLFRDYLSQGEPV